MPRPQCVSGVMTFRFPFSPFPASVILAGLLIPGSLPAQERKRGGGDANDPSRDLARPLRKFDTNKDGKLTGEEVRLARQAFNRGGRDPEMTADMWQGVLDYYFGEWRKRNYKILDTDADGKLNDGEKEQARKLWEDVPPQLSTLRDELVRKYDKNDDGNVTKDERRSFDREFNRRRDVIEQAVIEKIAPAPAPSPPKDPEPQ